MTRMQVALLTVGDPDRVTGGYLFHRRVADRAVRHDAELSFVSLPDLPLVRAVMSRPAWLRSGQIQRSDVVVLDSIAAAAAAPWLGRIERPVIGMLHQPPGGMEGGVLRRGLRARLDRLAYRRAGRLMVASEWLADQLVGEGFARDRLLVVPPGKDPGEGGGVDQAGGADVGSAGERHAALAAKLRAGRSCAALCVANWLPRKGLAELLQALALLPTELVSLHLVGDPTADPAYARRLRRRLAAADLKRRVAVHGVLPAASVRELYGGVDLFVLPSFEEPYGTVWGEAMAAGLPVVGWRAGNLPYLADDGVEALLAPIGDVRALARAIQQLATDPARRLAMGRAAARRAEARPTWDEAAALFFAAIREALAAGAVPR